jgi:hypothetical protein
MSHPHIQAVANEVLARHCRTTADRCSDCGQGWPCDATLLVEVLEAVEGGHKPQVVTLAFLLSRRTVDYLHPVVGYVDDKIRANAALQEAMERYGLTGTDLNRG